MLFWTGDKTFSIQAILPAIKKKEETLKIVINLKRSFKDLRTGNSLIFEESCLRNAEMFSTPVPV